MGGKKSVRPLLVLHLPQGPRTAPLRQDLHSLPRSAVDGPILARAAGRRRAGQVRHTAGTAEDGVRSRLADSAGDAGQRHGVGSALLLATRGAALTRHELHHTLQDSLDYLQRKQTPMTQSALALRTLDGVQAAVDTLSGGHPLTRIDGARDPVGASPPNMSTSPRSTATRSFTPSWRPRSSNWRCATPHASTQTA